MEEGTYRHLEESLGSLNEMHLDQVQAGGSCHPKCCKAKTNIREAIVQERTGKSLDSFATKENLSRLGFVFE